MAHHQLTALVLVLVLFTFAASGLNVYEVTMMNQICCDDVWPNGNCPGSDEDFSSGIRGAIGVLRCKHRDLNMTITENGWFDFYFTGRKKSPLMKFDVVKQCRLIVRNVTSKSDCPNLSVPLVANITSMPDGGIIDYLQIGKFEKLT